MKCTHVRMPLGGTAIVCSRGRRRSTAAKRQIIKRAAEAPVLPLEGGGETERHRLRRLLACLQRELDKRLALYPRWVAAGRMSDSMAALRIERWSDVTDLLEHALHGANPCRDRARIDRAIMEVCREIDRRRRVYPRMIADGRLSSAKADQEIAEMGEVLVWLQQQRAPK